VKYTTMIRNIVLTLVLAVVLVGCTQSAHTNIDQHNSTFVLGQQVNHDDHMHHDAVENEAQFLIEMIPHHQEAIDTSLLILESENQLVVQLATQIIDAQVEEIAQMNMWLETMYPDVERTSTYQNMMPDLLSLEGDARDRAYLEGMIDHHIGAILMAQQVQSLQLSEEVLQLTQNIILEQESEIMLMRSILEQLPIE